MGFFHKAQEGRHIKYKKILKNLTFLKGFSKKKLHADLFLCQNYKF